MYVFSLDIADKFNKTVPNHQQSVTETIIR